MELGRIQKGTIKMRGKQTLMEIDGETLPLEVDGKPQEGKKTEAFIYRDKDGSLKAMEKKPYIQVGEVARLKVVDQTKIGYFVDIGAPRDVLLPFTEATERIRVGEKYLFTLYVDKSQRLAVSMKVKDHLKTKSPYKVGDHVTGTVYHMSDKVGALVAVDDQFDGLIPKQEITGIYEAGNTISLRVTKVHRDGRMNLSPRELAHIQMATDADILLDLMEDGGGTLPVGDKSDPERIREVTGLTKKAFKRAVGKLYKERKVTPGPYSVKRKK
ncbi:MAG: S1-like domain-containing RNA-binding protein [Tissierellia bacterium]|nr:S1-like domain-containing RNA-binding protein [Tissierellia bacterium]